MNKVGDKISAENSNWSFGGEVYKNFDSHVQKSVPQYFEGQKIVEQISDFFVPNGSLVYDIGCSTGTLIEKLAKRHNNKSIQFIGCDIEKGMVSAAKDKCKKYKNIKIIKDSITNLQLKSSNLIISYYTIQFIHPNVRQDIFNKIYKSLNWGGAFIFFEKVRAPDARFQDISSLIYNEFKLDQGYSAEEIIGKSRSLKGVLEPFSTQGNIDLALRSGFKDITTVFKYVCFEGFLAIK
jgi:tRNA (cmo5U34)-methyltransferase